MRVRKTGQSNGHPGQHREKGVKGPGVFKKEQGSAPGGPDASGRRSPYRAALLLLAVGILAWTAIVLAPAWRQARLREAYVPELREMARRNPTDGQVQALLGARLSQQGDYKEAVAAFEQALADGENNADVWTGLGGAEAADNHISLAISAVRLGLSRGATQLNEAKARLHALKLHATPIDIALAIAPDGVAPIITRYAQGSFLNPLFDWWGKLFPESSGLGTRGAWITADQDNVDYQRLWGEALLLNGSAVGAEMVFKKALAMAPSSPELHLDMARALVKQGQEKRAMDEYQACLKLRPGWKIAVKEAAAIAPTVGGPRFVDFTPDSGITYRWKTPAQHPYTILGTIGNGCGFLDYDADGNLDILLVGDQLALYRGDGHGHFTDVTHQVGLDQVHGHFLGCAVGDFDNDGYDDLYISAFQGGVLLHNEHGKFFRDVTKDAGIAPQPWGTSCAFVDVDNDGRLDLFIGNYVHFGPDVQPQFCDYAGVKDSCDPSDYSPVKGVLYHNEGAGKFRDISQAWHAAENSGNNLGVACADYDGSHRQSIAIANDQKPGDLLQNTGSSFSNVGVASGTAYGPDGRAHGGMGIDWGDYDNDGKIDLAVMTSTHEAKCIYHNTGGGAFSDVGEAVGLSTRMARNVAFGVKWVDYDNDGWLDLAIANGHVQDMAAQIEPGATFRQLAQIFHNEQGRRFKEVSAQAGAPFQTPVIGRGLAVGDFDNDGREDVLIVDSDGPPVLAHNETDSGNHWVTFNLVGTRSNRDGYGAMVTVTAGGITQMRLCGSDGSYLSASDRRVHVGVGDATTANVSIRWPSGLVSSFPAVAADHFYTAVEGAASLSGS